MPSIISEYASKRMGPHDLRQELKKLITAYNKHTGRVLFVYAADTNKSRVQGVNISLVQDDFYTIQDILREATFKDIDVYLETPGGSGEAAEEIARFLRGKFDTVDFVIAAESKSAGTILALSGDRIHMTSTGSLGPIDAQVRIGRSVVSAHDYIEWIEQKRTEAEKAGKLNPFDAVMVAQISPGELSGVVNSLEFAKDLVKDWLEKHKFKNWEKTETRKLEVTPEMRKRRAEEVAGILCDHTTWRTHGRSLKISDLKENLQIESIDADKALADIVYRIRTIVRMLFDSSTIYKLYFMADFEMAKTYAPGPATGLPITPPPTRKGSKTVDAVEFNVKCPKCNKIHKVLGVMDIPGSEAAKHGVPLNPRVTRDEVLMCDSPDCNFAIDLKPVKSQLELQSKRRIALSSSR
jgi:hypothetical protein